MGFAKPIRERWISQLRALKCVAGAVDRHRSTRPCRSLRTASQSIHLRARRLHGMIGQRAIPARPQTISPARRPSRASQIANSPIEDRIVPAVAAGILIARVTVARCAGSAGGARPSTVCLTIVEKSVAVSAPRNRGDDGGRLPSYRPAAIASTHCLQRLVGGKSWHIHAVHLYLPWVGQPS
jgi:hypothetical protein